MHFLGLESVEFRCLGGGIGVMVGGVWLIVVVLMWIFLEGYF